MHQIRLLIIIQLMLVMGGASYGAPPKTFTLMTYNVQNLFDTTHDEGKSDWTYLPLAVKKTDPDAINYCKSQTNFYYRKECYTLDWTNEVLMAKIMNIGAAIKGENGKGPDVVVLEEVENISVLKALVKEGLKGQKYNYITLIEGPDFRGVDVGVISRYPIVDSKLHEVNLGDTEKPTRGILEATIDVKGTLITVLGNHWPSQGGGAITSEYRFKAATRLHEIAASLGSNPVIAVGDFNTVDKDSPHGINEMILNRNITPYFDDTRLLSTAPLNVKGTYWYQKKWDYLDKIFILQNGPNISAATNSLRVNAPQFILKPVDWYDKTLKKVVTIYVPNKFDPLTKQGYSDHLGLIVKINIKSSKKHRQ